MKTTWKYGTGNSSDCRSASQATRAAPWHFGQWRLRQGDAGCAAVIALKQGDDARRRRVHPPVSLVHPARRLSPYSSLRVPRQWRAIPRSSSVDISSIAARLRLPQHHQRILPKMSLPSAAIGQPRTTKRKGIRCQRAAASIQTGSIRASTSADTPAGVGFCISLDDCPHPRT